jgi:hypothetical protein
VPPVGTTLVPFFTQFGDFDSFELAQRLVDALPALAAAGVRVAAIGVGTPAAARAFAQFTNFPLDMLYADPDAACYDALRFAPGAGRPGGPLPQLSAAPGQLKLLAMCAGLGSPGTLTEVFRGYLVRACVRVRAGGAEMLRLTNATQRALTSPAGRPRRAASIQHRLQR